MKGNYRTAIDLPGGEKGGGGCEMKGNYRTLAQRINHEQGGGGCEMKGNYRESLATTLRG